MPLSKGMYVVVSRFKQNTWEENCEYRRRKRLMGCVYGTPLPMAATIPYKAPVYVLELNFTEHKIMGVGLILNLINVGNSKVYADSQHNSYSYKGKYRVDRQEMIEQEEELMTKLDEILFWQCKRWRAMQGMTQIPVWVRQLPELNYQEILRNMFLSRFMKHPVEKDSDGNTSKTQTQTTNGNTEDTNIDTIDAPAKKPSVRTITIKRVKKGTKKKTLTKA